MSEFTFKENKSDYSSKDIDKLVDLCASYEETNSEKYELYKEELFNVWDNNLPTKNYRLIILNDDYHSFPCVKRTMMQFFNMDAEQAEEATQNIHDNGELILVYGQKEHLEMIVAQIHKAHRSAEYLDCVKIGTPNFRFLVEEA